MSVPAVLLVEVVVDSFRRWALIDDLLVEIIISHSNRD